MDTLSPLQKKRLQYQPSIPPLLKHLDEVHFKAVENSRRPLESLKKLFPHTFANPSYQLVKGEGRKKKLKIGVVFSGGQAAGGHNVIAGIFDAKAEIIGFLGGPEGLVKNEWKKIDQIDAYRNQGGFDLLGSGRTKIETAEQLAATLSTASEHQLDGIVIIGGDDSNTNAAILAEYFLQHGSATRVVGVPKTIDGDLRSEDIEISFGFDSACKTYSELIGNIARDALSAKKYYHFIKLMGRSASHIALECALSTQPNLALISEERKSLPHLVGEIVDLIRKRAAMGKEYGIVLIPEGLIEFVPELNELTQELQVEKDPHGNINVSKIETEKILAQFVKKEVKVNIQEHFLGYEGRSCLPSNFDATYCYALGLLAAVSIREGLTGVVCAIKNLEKEVAEWEPKAISILQLMHMENRLGKEKPVIKKSLVDINSPFFLSFKCKKKIWEIEDHYRYPGPIQFFGDRELTDSIPFILRDKNDYNSSYTSAHHLTDLS